MPATYAAQPVTSPGCVVVGKSPGSRSPDVAVMRPSVRAVATTVVRWGSANGSAKPAL